MEEEYDYLDSIIEEVVKERGRKEDMMMQWKNNKHVYQKKKHMRIIFTATASIAILVCIYFWKVPFHGESNNNQSIALATDVDRATSTKKSTSSANARSDDDKNKPKADDTEKNLVTSKNMSVIKDKESEETNFPKLTEDPHKSVESGVFSIPKDDPYIDELEYDKEWDIIVILLGQNHIKEALIKLRTFRLYRGKHQAQADSIYNRYISQEE